MADAPQPTSSSQMGTSFTVNVDSRIKPVDLVDAAMGVIGTITKTLKRTAIIASVGIVGLPLLCYMLWPSDNTPVVDKVSHWWNTPAAVGRVATPAAPVTTYQCPGGSEPHTLGRHLTKISDFPCQLRVVVPDSCAVIYDRSQRKIGKICAHHKTVVDGIGFYLSAENGIPIDVTVTRCPFGEVSYKIGTCS